MADAAPVQKSGHFLPLCTLFVIVMLIHDIIERVAFSSFYEFGKSLGVVNIFLWIAYAVVLYRLWGVRFSALDGRGFGLALTCLALLLILFGYMGYGIGTGIVAFGLGLLLLGVARHSHPPETHHIKAASIVMLAISAHEFWGPVFFTIFTPAITWLDAAITAAVLYPVRPDIVWEGRTFVSSGGHSLAIVGACSAFQSISTGLLAGVSFYMTDQSVLSRRALIFLASLMASLAVFNVVRLVLLTWDRTSYDYWHGGDGTVALALGITVFTLMAAQVGANKAKAM
jgi:exosortase/archaeosortase family protein